MRIAEALRKVMQKILDGDNKKTCYWQQDIHAAICPKHGKTLAECPIEESAFIASSIFICPACGKAHNGPWKHCPECKRAMDSGDKPC